MLNIAHRGYSSIYPENTILSFDKALEYGADGLEFDVQISKDGVLMVFHDEKVDRVTNYKGYLKDYSSIELKKMKVLNSNESIIDLESLFKYYKYYKKNKIVYNIELKNSVIKYKELEKKVCKLLKEYDLIDDVIISSFNHKSIQEIKKLYPEIKCGLITLAYLYNPVDYIKTIGAGFYHPMLETLDEKTCYKLKSEEIEINAWTSKRITNLNYIKKLNLHGIITNYPNYINMHL